MKKLLYLIVVGLLTGVGNVQAQKVLEYKKFYEEGQTKFKAGKYAESIAALDKAIARMPYYSALYTQRGKTKLKTKNYVGAVEDFTITLQKKPYDYHTYLQRGIAYYHLQDYTNAELDLKDVLQYKPYDREAKKYLAQTQVRLQEIAQQLAVKQNEALVNQNPSTESEFRRQQQWERRQRRFNL